MNKQTFSTQTLSTLKVIVLALVLGLGISYAQANWAPPLASPPTCVTGDHGCDAPINVSATAQTKAGNLTAGGLTLGRLWGGSSFISPNGFGSQALYLLGGTSGFTGVNNQWRWYVSESGDTDQPGKANASDFCINGAGCLGASGGIPIGGIIMWSGSVANIPSGWKLCNGNNGTPNLSGRFIVGAGVTAPYTPNQIGGTRDAVIVSHKHTFLTDDNGIGGADAAAIGISGITYLNGGGAQGGGSLYQLQTSLPRSVDGWGQSITLTGTGNALETGVDKNIPPFYALAFIMRTL